MSNRSLIILLITTLVFTTPQFLFSTSVLVVKSKSENGNDPCERLNCIPVLSNEVITENSEGMSIIDYAMTLSQSTIEIEININKNPSIEEFPFPWHLRVFSDSGVELGRSHDINQELFTDSDEFSDIRSTQIEASLFGGIIQSTSQLEQLISQQPCLVDECGYQYSDLKLYFRLFAGNFEIESNHHSFVSPNLEPSSNVQHLTFKTCECSIERGTRGIDHESLLPAEGKLSDPMAKESNSWEISGPRVLDKGKTNEFIEIFPNPASSSLWLTTNFLENKIIQIEILDARGTIIRRLAMGSESNLQVDLTGFHSGMYFFRAKIGHEFLIKRLIIDK